MCVMCACECYFSFSCTHTHTHTCREREREVRERERDRERGRAKEQEYSLKQAQAWQKSPVEQGLRIFSMNTDCERGSEGLPPFIQKWNGYSWLSTWLSRMGYNPEMEATPDPDLDVGRHRLLIQILRWDDTVSSLLTSRFGTLSSFSSTRFAWTLPCFPP